MTDGEDEQRAAEGIKTIFCKKAENKSGWIKRIKGGGLYICVQSSLFTRWK